MQKLCSLLKLLLFIILLSVDCTLFHFQFINTTVVNFQWFGPLSLLNPLSYEFSCLSVHLFLEITLLFTDFLLEVTVQMLSDGVNFWRKLLCYPKIIRTYLGHFCGQIENFWTSLRIGFKFLWNCTWCEPLRNR